MSDLDEELILEFKVESQEHLATVEPALLQIEDADADKQNELLHMIFRAVHSVKGASGFFGLDTIQGLSHTMESLLMRVRDGEIPHSPSMTDSLLAGLDMLGQMVDALPDLLDLEVTHIAEELIALTNGETPTKISESELEADSSTDDAASTSSGPSNALEQKESKKTEAEAAEAKENAGAPTMPPQMNTTEVAIEHLSEEQFEEIRRFGRNLYGVCLEGEPIADDDMDALMVGIGDLLWEGAIAEKSSLIVSSVLDRSLLAKAMGVEETSIEQLKIAGLTSKEEEKPTVTESDDAASTKEPEPTQAAPEAPPKSVAEKTDDDATPPPSPTAEKAASSRRTESNETVRVSVHLLDRLMDQAGELVLSRNQLLRYFAENPDASVKGILQDIDLITSELQGDIMNTRMQPIGGVFNKFTRIVRDLSRKLEKKIKLVIEGAEVELDKSIVELLSDPLTHLVRNSLDHGIESPSERLTAGKDEQGEVVLRAFHEGGQVHIVIEDDGKGIDPDRMRSVAVSKGLMPQAEADRLSDADARMLIFAPGFSTAEQVSDVSGRGVGMDVVKTNIAKLGGKVEIDSELGRGTRLTIALPLTLAIIPSLVVEINNERLAIPQVNLVELVRINQSEIDKHISRVSEAPVLRLRGNLLPLISLAELLHIDEASLEGESDTSVENEGESDTNATQADQDSSSEIEAMNVVVLQVGGTTFGLIVDTVLDSEEIVVKPLSSMLDGIPLYSGATIMGDGRVAMILDANGIAEVAELRLEDKKKAQRDANESLEDPDRTKRSLVLFNNATEEQFAIDLDRLIRLEEISPDQLETVGNDLCIQYLGEGLPLVRLEEILSVRPIPPDLKQLYVLIPKVEGRSIGILAGGIVDAVDVEILLDEAIQDSPAVEGRALIQERLTLVLNPDKLSLIEEKGAAA